jgi:CheY-like chemotaxis protein
MPYATLLVVDDDEDTRLSLEALLALWGYSVATARDGQEALERASVTPPRLIVTDLSMPRVDGVELCQRVKRSKALRDTPIIVTSALPDPPASLHDLVYRFFRKPLDVCALRDTIWNCLAERR